MDAASDWLADTLADGPRLVKELRTECEKDGVATATLYRAKRVLGVIEYKTESRKWWVLASQGGDEYESF